MDQPNSLAGQIAHDLLVPESRLLRLAASASHHYKSYSVPKRNGGRREIHHPSRELKAVQRWLARVIISQWPIHDDAYGYVKGRNIHAHALQHAHFRFLLRMDFANFFPSIVDSDIQTFLRRDPRPPGTAKWQESDLVFFTKIVCRSSKLTIGAPSSPALSNALCYGLDRELSALAKRFDSCYTRYADDLFFSCDIPDRLQEIERLATRTVAELPLPANLSINPTKTRHSSRRGRRQATGLVLTPDGQVVPGRNRKRRARSLLFHYDNLTPGQRLSLAGELAFLFNIDPGFENVLILKYGNTMVRKARKGA